MEETILTELDPIGAVFTPLQHARKTIWNRGLYKSWLNGASILDPTAGSGHLIEAFICTAKERKDNLTDRRLRCLCGVEMQPRFISDFHKRIKDNYAVDFPLNRFIQGDFLFTELREEFDFLLGNPPWLNFCDLEDRYKEEIKPLFVNSGLTGNKRELLLGGSRIDLAALIITEAIKKNLVDRGQAYFYLPLSLFLGEGAHKQFRLLLDGGHFSLDFLEDFREFPLFPGVSTRYGFAGFTKGAKTVYPVPYRHYQQGGTFRDSIASPLDSGGSPLVAGIRPGEIPRIAIPAASKPRQGLNTCGANGLFIFDEIAERRDHLLLLRNKQNEALLPGELVYPLLGAGQFKQSATHRYVFLPYSRKGKPLSATELSSYPEAERYLQKHRHKLENRKGVLIGSAIKKGLWWSLLGVGPYSFSPWKIVWEAYGKKEFRPRLFSSTKGQPWQPNQALQAFLPFASEKEARQILSELKNPVIESILKKQGMEGTCNWAQPGKMMRFFALTDGGKN